VWLLKAKAWRGAALLALAERSGWIYRATYRELRLIM
jgi:hypothetical protein